MKIWQVGASSNPYRVDGVSRTVWLLARQQARLGHEVSLVLDTPAEPAAVALAAEAGLKLVHVDATPFSYAKVIRQIIDREKPHIVHMHSVFIVRQATMGRMLQRCGVPYVITPHGGLAPQVLRRGVVKKTVYAWLRERPRFLNSSAVVLVTPAEERMVRSFIPEYRGLIRWIANPVETEALDPHRWSPPQADRRVVYLGRFDVLVKGIDILIEIARRLPDLQFDLYGTEDPKTLAWLNRLKQNLPANVKFHDPVFGPDKAKMLCQACMYIQPSRWEGFPVSLAECLYLGVPSAIADTLDISQLFYQHRLGLVISLDPARAAAQIRQAISDQALQLEWSQRARRFAEQLFHPAAAAERHIRLYQRVIESQRGRISRSATGVPPRLFSAQMRSSLKKSISRLAECSSDLLDTNGRPRTVILCYHSINRSSADLSVNPEVFRRQLLVLKQMGFEFMNFGDLVDRLLRWGGPRNNVACITFDDGYEDNLLHAAPILSELCVPATFFITTGLMSQDQTILEQFHRLTNYPSKYLSPRQVEQLSRLGFEIGSHTHSHANLARLAPQQIWNEVCLSKRMLEDATARAVHSFAYPFGKRHIHYTPATVSVVRQSGFRGAAAVAFRSVTSRQSIRIFELPRFFITRADDEATFVKKVSGHFDWLGKIQEATPAWMKGFVSPEDRY